MKWVKRILGVVVVIVALGAVAVWQGVVNFDGHVGICRHDGEIAKETHDGAAAAARRFVEAMLGTDPAAAHAMFTAEMQAKVTREQVAKLMAQIAQPAPFSDLRLSHVFEPSTAGTKTAPMMCDGVDGSKFVFVNATPGVAQTHVLMNANSRNNGWAMNTWLLQESGAWRVHGFHTSMAAIAGLDAVQLLDLARAQNKKGNSFNAHMLYVAASSTVDRGPDLQLSIEEDANKALSEHKAPPELTGPPPFAWTLGDVTHSLEQVQIVGIDKRLGLLLHHRDPEWKVGDNTDAERRNRLFIDALVKAHPEFSQSFAFIVARVQSKDDPTTWGTVYNFESGYLEDDNKAEAPQTTAKKPK